MFASPAFSHRLPAVFPRPDAFEPERFAAPREEDKAAPFSFIGFGGGRHGCMGSNFAYLQARAIPSASPLPLRLFGSFSSTDVRTPAAFTSVWLASPLEPQRQVAMASRC